MPVDNRYDRQERIKGWNQSLLSNARVMIAGAGAIGNELIKNLAMAGIGHMLIVDSDIIEKSNLSRSVLFRDADIQRPKAEVAAARAKEINPDIDVSYIVGNLFFDIGLGFYRHSDLVISGLDSIAARAHVGNACFLTAVPFLDAGMWSFGGEVRWFIPSQGPCFECTLSREDQKRAYERHSCTSFHQEESEQEPPLPTTISTTAIVAGILSQEAIKYLSNWKITPGEAIVYNGMHVSMHNSKFKKKDGCMWHQPYDPIISIHEKSENLTARQLFKMAQKNGHDQAILSLGRDLLIHFYCHHCQKREDVNKLTGKISASEVQCPVCNNERDYQTISQLYNNELFCDHSLSELGIPPGDILALSVKKDVWFYELSGDLSHWHP